MYDPVGNQKQVIQRINIITIITDKTALFEP
jgi:hypothetical protein